MLPIIRTKNSFPTLADSFFRSNLLDNFWGEGFSSYSPSVNVKESDTEFQIEIAAPGVEKKDFQLHVEDTMLTVSYEHNSEHDEKNDELMYLRREFLSQSFKKSFALPENVNSEKIAASYNNGILTIEIPKMKEKSKLAKLISIS